MKKALLIAAALCLTAPAFASKARKASIPDCVACTDVQDVFTNPARMFTFGDLVTAEFGTAGTLAVGQTYETASVPEGGIFRASGNTKWGFYAGHRNSVTDLLKLITGWAMSSAVVQNPWTAFYGQKGGNMDWAASFTYFDQKTGTGATEKKNNGMGLRVGATTNAWQAYLGMGLSGKESSGANEIKGNSSYEIGGQYNLSGDSIAYADVITADSSQSGAATTKGTYSAYILGWENKVKSDAAHVFYGVKYSYAKLANDATGAGATTSENTLLPIYLGVEADAASWLALRASVSKAVLIDSQKTTTAGVDNELTGSSPAALALGASFKWNKVTMDWIVASGAAATSGSGVMSTTGFGTNASLTYSF